MSQLQLFVSPPGTGKTTRCIDLFRQEISKSQSGIDSRSYFVLPSREHADRIQNLVLKKGMPGLFNAHILSINDLAERVLGWRGLARPTASARRLAVVQALSQEGVTGQNPFDYFASSVGFRGFQELALETIREFKAGLLSVSEFEKRVQPLRKSDPVFAQKYKDFSIFFKRYHHALETLGFSEVEDALAEVEDLKEEGPSPELIIFDGFYHFTRAQQKLLILISKWAKKTVVTLTLNVSHPAGDLLFGYPKRTQKFLEGAGFKTLSLGSQSHRVSNPALTHLESQLFYSSPKAYPGISPVTILSAPSQRVEFEMIARQIKRLYRQENYHYSDICVIFRSVSGRRSLVESVFGEFDIPVAVHERKRLLESGLAVALYRFLKLGAEDWPREDVLYLAKSNYFRKILSLESALEIEKAALRKNLVQGAQAWNSLCLEASLPEEAGHFLRFLTEASQRTKEASSAHTFSFAIESFLKAFECLPGEAQDLDIAAMASIKSILASIRRHSLSSEGFSGSEVSGQMLLGMEEGLLSTKPLGRNRVQVYDVVMALPKEYKVVFVADLLEKVFPQSVNEDPLFKDAERHLLNGNDPVLEERGWRQAGERYFFYMALTRAKEKIYLTHSTHNNEGKPVLASFFIDEVLRCFEKESVKHVLKDASSFLPEPEEWESSLDVERSVAALFSQGGPHRKFAEKILSCWKAPEPLLSAFYAPSRISGAGFLDPEVGRRLLQVAGPFSASSLEAFLRCPFRYFAEDLLRLTPPAEGREEAHRGTLLHETLYQYFKKFSPEDLRLGAHLKDPTQMKKDLEAILERDFEKSPLASAPLYRRMLWLSLMRRMLGDYVDLELSLAGADFVPTYFEYSFGKGKADYLRLPDDSGEILLKGSIDRIDVDASGGAMVIDYKSSSRSLKKKVEKAEEIQMPIYLLAASHLLRLQPAGMEHRILKTGKREDSGLSGESLQNFLLQTQERVRQAVREIRSGRIEVAPKDCRFCEWDSVCRVEAKKNRG